MPLIRDKCYVARIIFDPNEGVAVGDGGTILHTTDGGSPGKALRA